MSLLTEDIYVVISRAISPHAKVLDHRIEPFSEGKNGIFGEHRLLVVEVELAGANINKSFFVKTPPESSLITDFIMDESTFVEEVNFYQQVQPLMMQNYKGESWSANCYLTKKNLLVFEDLRSQNYTTRSDFPMDGQSIKQTLATLARFHASSVLTEKKLGRSLKQAFPGSFEEIVYTKNKKFGLSTPIAYEAMKMMATKYGFQDSVNLVPKIHDRVHNLVRERKDQCNVICHSDLWRNNIMFNDEGGESSCILVDFQLLRYASPAVDINMFLYLNTTLEYRKTNEMLLFKHYYSVFSETLVKNSCELNGVLSYSEMLKNYQKHKLVGLTYAAMYGPGLHLKPAEIAKLMNDAQLLTDWLMHDRNSFIKSNLDADPVYEEKIKNIIYELMEEAKQTFHS
ncbi:hypothetical protein TKK_0016703 [Trichogramma kaykai]|uniref:CHK kinase-like domain-containing protein n=1 Tax=Trichogramma kaykai TaxID=54128 RepID=A0ABD2W605_9HYME